MVAFRDIQLNLLINLIDLLSIDRHRLIKLLINRQYLNLTLQPTNRSHYSNIPIDSFIYYVLYDKAYLLGYVVVRAYELVYLVELTVSLG